MRNTDVTAEELRIAKDFISRSLPGLFETTLQAVNAVRDMYVYNLPLTYYSTLPQSVEGVTAADVRRVAQKYVTPEHMIVVGVGDRSKIQPGIEKLELGTVEVRDLDGNPVQTAQAAPGN